MTLPAGLYYVGDLCYVMTDPEWDQVCNLLASDRDGQLSLPDGRQFVIHSTAFGDGEYNDQAGRAYGVDSGTIGAILVEDITDPNFDRTNSGGHLIEFESSFTSSYDKNGGVISIGRIRIQTDVDEPIHDDFLDSDF
jgi:hypothetical protein